MKATVLLGLQYGDEGKGKMIDFLSKNFQAVARFQGGENAGHTVYVKSRKFVLHLLPSGVIRGKPCFLGNGMVINVEKLLEEIKAMEKAVGKVKIGVSYKAHVVFPFHKEAEGELGKKIGTTKKGIGIAYSDKMLRRGARVIDLIKNKKRVVELFKAYKREEKEAKAYLRKVREIKKYICVVEKEIRKYRKVLIEGAQGGMLDIDHGTYPFVTSSNTTIGGALAGLGINHKEIEKVIGVAKAYTTRVGNGPFVSEIKEKRLNDYLVEKGNEFGATTGRRRRVGWLDLVMLKYTTKLNGVDEIALTKIDVLSGLEKIKVVVGYRTKEGEIIKDYMPAEIEKVKPLYKEMKGFEIEGKSKREVLKRIKHYIKEIEKAVGVKVKYISYGKERSQTIVINKG